MKKLLTASMLMLVCIYGMCQLPNVSINFEEKSFKSSNILKARFTKFEIWEYKAVISPNSETGSFKLKFGDSAISFSVKSNTELTKSDFSITANNAEYSEDPTLRHYNSTTDSKNYCRISIADNFILGQIKIGDKEYYIEKLKNFAKTEADDLAIVYSAEDEIQTNINCGTESEHIMKSAASVSSDKSGKAARICRTIDYAIAVDYSSFVNHGSSIVETSNYVLSIMNLVEGNYVGSFADDLYFKISEILIFTSEEVNPWKYSTSIHDNLYSFTDWNTTGFTKPFDLASYWFASFDQATIVGLAWVGVTCFGYGYGCNAIREYGGTLDNMRFVVAHEIGHNFGCAHTTGYIMNRSVSNSSSWAPESITTFNNTIAGSNGKCFTECDYTACENTTIQGISISDNGKRLLMNWTPDATKPVKIEYRKSKTGAFTLLGLYSSPLDSATVIHTSGCGGTEYFQIKLSPICSSTKEGIPSLVIKQAVGEIPLPASSEIIASDTEICSGTNIKFVATTSIKNPTYDWKINGGSIGASKDTFNIKTLKDNDDVICTVSAPSEGCYTNTTINSNNFKIIVHPLLKPLVTIEGGSKDTGVCQGKPITITATPTNGGTEPIYKWKVNNALIDASGESITLTNAANKDAIVCVLKSNEACVIIDTGISNKINLNIIEVNPSIIVEGNTLVLDELRFGAKWQWYKDGEPILYARDAKYIASDFGTYTVRETYKSCSSTSPEYVFAPKDGSYWPDIILFPNPVSSYFYAQTASTDIKIKNLQIYNLFGKLVYSSSFGNNNAIQVNISALPPGMYFANFQTNTKALQIKFLKK